MRALLIFLFGALLPCSVFAQDIIHKNDSTTIEAKVQEIGETEIKYKKFANQDGPVYTVKKSDVSYIMYQNGEKEVYSVPPPPVVKVTYDTLAYIEKMLGVKLKPVTSPDTGLLITDVQNTGRVSAPGLNPPKNNILLYIGTSDKKDELRKSGIKMQTTDAAVRAIVDYKKQGINKVYILCRFNRYVEHVYNVDLTDLVFEQTVIVETERKDSIAQKLRTPSPYKKGHFGFNVGTSMRNDYSTLDLNLWMYEMNGVYDDAGMSDGPEAFYFLQMYYSFPVNRKAKRPVNLGISLLMNYRKDTYGFWSIQGRVISYAPVAPVTYMRLRPIKFGVGLPFRFPMGDYHAFVFTPTFMYASVTGYSSGSDPNFADARVYGNGSNGIGFSAEAGAEFFFGKKKMIGAGAMIGFRKLRTVLYYSPESDQVNYEQVLFQSGEPVHVDLDGLYIQLGFSLRFPRKQ
jgi:hypothetical protein